MARSTTTRTQSRRRLRTTLVVDIETVEGRGGAPALAYRIPGADPVVVPLADARPKA